MMDFVLHFSWDGEEKLLDKNKRYRDLQKHFLYSKRMISCQRFMYLQTNCLSVLPSMCFSQQT
jgi:hypothetical protein